MPLIIDRFEDADLAVLETDDGESVVVPRAVVPPEAKAGDVLVELNGGPVDGPLRYAVDFEATARRRREAEALRASLSEAPEGDLEL